MHGSDVGDVLLDCFGLNSACETGGPRHDGELGCGEDRSVVIVQAVELHILDEAGLPGVVCCAGAGGKPVP